MNLMKPVSQLTKDDVKDIKLVCFDVDGVTIKKGTIIKEKEITKTKTLTIKTQLLENKVMQKLSELKKYYFVAINSGRSTIYLKDVFNELLWNNVALIGEVGIFSLLDGQIIQHEKFDDKTLTKMRNLKNELKKYADKTRMAEAFEPKQFLITMHAPLEDKNIYDIVKKVDPEGEFQTIWSGEAFDILPKRLNKGVALANLCKHLGINLEQTIAIGNGRNDKDMTEMAGIGVTTEPKVLEANFYTVAERHLGGEELIDKLLELAK